jgi:hypothetical protein
MKFRTSPPPDAPIGSHAFIAWAVAESLAWPANTPQGVYNWWVRHVEALAAAQPPEPRRLAKPAKPAAPEQMQMEF